MQRQKSSSQWRLEYLAVFLGGALGSLCRFALGALIDFIPGNFPYGTVVINIIGSLIIGYTFIYFSEHNKLNGAWLALVNIGFLGGFTTFSSFNLDNVTLLEQAHFILFTINFCATIGLCFSASAIGVFIARRIYARP